MLHLPAVHTLAAQGLSALHAKPSNSGLGAQLRPIWHSPMLHSLLSALQSVGVPLPQEPSAAHFSPVVQGSPSSQELPTSPSTISHCFAASTQAQTWHASGCRLPPVPVLVLPSPPVPPPPFPPAPVLPVLVPPPLPGVSGHVRTTPTHVPAVQTSVTVQKRPSSQGFPSFAASASFVHEPLTQTPTPHASLSPAQSLDWVQPPPFPVLVPVTVDVLGAPPLRRSRGSRRRAR